MRESVLKFKDSYEFDRERRLRQEAESDCRQLRKQVLQLEEELTEAKYFNEGYFPNSKSIEALEECKAQILNKDNEIFTLQEKLAQSSQLYREEERRRFELEEEVRQLQYQLNESQKEISHRDRAIEEWSKVITTFEDKLKVITAENDSLKAEKAKTMNNKSPTKSTSKTSLTPKNTPKKTESLKSTVKMLKEDLKDMRKRHEHLKSQKKEIENLLNIQLKKIENNLTSENEDLILNQKLIESKDQEINYLREELDSLKNRVGQSHAKESELKMLNEDRNKLQHMVEEMQSQISDVIEALNREKTERETVSELLADERRNKESTELKNRHLIDKTEELERRVENELQYYRNLAEDKSDELEQLRDFYTQHIEKSKNIARELREEISYIHSLKDKFAGESAYFNICQRLQLTVDKLKHILSSIIY